MPEAIMRLSSDEYTAVIWGLRSLAKEDDALAAVARSLLDRWEPDPPPAGSRGES
jgi:hypothetical protein